MDWIHRQLSLSNNSVPQKVATRFARFSKKLDLDLKSGVEVNYLSITLH